MQARTLAPSAQPTALAVTANGTPALEKMWKGCIYCRLSREDGDKEESDSITNQKALIRDYAANLPDVSIVDEYVDDGFSGVNFERPAFVRMMDDIKAGRIDCVIVKEAYVKQMTKVF